MAEGESIAIVAYEVLNEDRERFLRSWKQANNHLQQQSGYISSALHEAVSANPDFRYVNIAHWENADAFRTATQSNGFREASGALEAFPIHAAVYDQART